MDVGQNPSLGDSDSGHELVELLIVPDGQLEVARDDPHLLVVAGSVASQLEGLSSEVLQDSSQVDRGSTSSPLGVVPLAQKTVDPSHRELKSSSHSPRLLLLLESRLLVGRLPDIGHDGVGGDANVVDGIHDNIQNRSVSVAMLANMMAG